MPPRNPTLGLQKIRKSGIIGYSFADIARMYHTGAYAPHKKNHFQKHFGGTDMKPIQHPERHLARRYDCVTRSKEFQQAVHGNYVEDPTPVYNRLRELEQAYFPPRTGIQRVLR